MFPKKFRNIFVAETMFSSLLTCFQINNINNTLRFVRANISQQMFPSLPTVGNMTKHRQETMFPQQCFLVCPGLKSFSRLVTSMSSERK